MNDQKKTQAIVAVFLLAAYVFTIFFAAFLNEGELLQTDQAMWASAAWLMRTDIVPTQGWFWGVITDRVGSGQQLGNSYSMSLILPWALSFFMPVAASIKVSMLASALLLVIGFYFVAELYMPKGWAFVCSLVLLTPMFDNMVSGMWYNYFSLGCGLVFWRSCHEIYGRFDLRWAVPAVVSLSLAVYSHQVGTFLCIAIWLSYMILVLAGRRSRPLAMVAVFTVIPVLAALLSYPQVHALLAPKLGHVQHAGAPDLPITGPLETLRRMFFIRVWGAVNLTHAKAALMGAQVLTVGALFGVGLYSLARSKDREKIVQTACLILVTFILISRAYNLLDMNIGLLRSLSKFYDRFQLLSQIYLVLVSGVGLAYLSGLPREKGRYGKYLRIAFPVCLVMFAAVAVRTPMKVFCDRTGQLGTLGTSTVRQDVHALWAWMNEHVEPEKERVYFEDTYRSLLWNDADNPESSKSHVLALTSMYTGVSQINGWCGYTHYFAGEHECGMGRCLFGQRLDHGKLSDDRIRSEMKLLNCRYLIVHTGAAKQRLAQAAFLKEAARIGRFAVYENTELTPAWAYKLATGEAVDLKKITPVSYALQVRGGQNERIQISLAGNANWKAYHEGREIRIDDHRALMQISLPAEGDQTILLKHVINRKVPVLMFCLGAAGTILLTGFAVFTGRKKSDRLLCRR